MLNTVVNKSQLILATGLNFPAITNLTTLLIVIAELIGIPYLAWALYNLARSYKKRDQGGMDSAIDDIIVAAIFIAAGGIVAFLRG